MSRGACVEFEGVIGSLQFTYQGTEKQLNKLFVPVGEYFIVDMTPTELDIHFLVNGTSSHTINVSQIKEQGMHFGIRIKEVDFTEELGNVTLWEKTLKVLDEKSFYQTIKENCSVFKQEVAFG